MNISFIGLGKMGYPMAKHLVQANHQLEVFNRSPSKSEDFKRNFEQCTIANSLTDCGKHSEIIILCIGNDEDVRNTLTGKDSLYSNLKPGTLVIDHTTTSAELACEMQAKLLEKQVDYVDAPVSGGEQGAISGQLTIMCGGQALAAERAQGITQAYSKSFTHMGPIGSGQLTKMVNQICVAGLIEALAEGIHFGQQAGLDMEKVMKVVGSGAASSWQLQNRYQTMLEDQYDFGFAVDHMRKDLEICLKEAKKMNTSLPSTAMVDQLYGELQQSGHGQLDTSSLLKRLQNK
ncbi:NAD(P)-dependent oxidoreductase [Bermanella marisrubri]|uniref:Putative oxidoreductase protein n=1 Tax=Bermanella marisrubri TaxID=207949 RepID=Q1N6I0_9GAMM|nr:NAD(P)-dependent oxidoreductase [Bermanella marisrubri]EAT13612.1 putative oxidoreductase protein [Oceanobacter sp. RED65] [Bermanella marisrubri]QIZ84400.1 NAD(P)-dependent oxidoreductase [Bermanella marisrubri]